MGVRRTARETALQFLYQEDFTLVQGQEFGYDLEDRFQLFCTLFQVNRKARGYAFEILKGIKETLAHVDQLISGNAVNWRLNRIAATDRNLLRVAVWEMAFREDVPVQVAINEAVEIAKRYGGEDSPKFINGVLDAVRLSME